MNTTSLESLTSPHGTHEADHYLKKELYERIQRDPQIFEFLQAGSLDGIWYWDLTEPENEWMSGRLWETFGYAPEEKKHLATEWQELIHPDDLKLAIDNFNKHTEDPSHPYDQLVRYRHRKGHWVTVRCRGLILRNENGNPVRMLGCHTDLTELKQAESQLQEINEHLENLVTARTKELAEKNRQLEQFAYAVSHDLKAPLRGISTAVGWLEEELAEGLSENAQENLSFLSSRSKRLSTLIEGVLHFSRAGLVDISSTDVDTHQVVTDVIAGFRPDERARISRPEPLPRVRHDAHQLFQLFQNLINNALTHGLSKDPAKATVTIQCTIEDDFLRFSVTDQGPGILPKYQERIFDLFSTLQPRDAVDSAGVGLSICKTIVERSGGHIGVDSALGQGSSFWFTLPRKQPHSESLQ